MEYLLIYIISLVLSAARLRALRRRFEVVDKIFYFSLIVVFISTWVTESFWWALFAGVIVILYGVIFYGIGSQTKVTRRYGTYKLPECESCGFDELEIIEETETTVSTVCPRCGRKVLFFLNGGVSTNNYPQNDLTEGSTRQRSNSSDDWRIREQRELEKEEENKRQEEERRQREEKERRKEEYERLKSEYESLKSEAQRLYSQGETYRRDAEDYRRKAIEYNDDNYMRSARDYMDKAEIYFRGAEDMQRKADYYYDQARKYY